MPTNTPSQRGGPNEDEIKAFPKDFRMVAGDPFKRSFDDDFPSQAVSFVCLDYNAEPKPETNEFPNENCPDGLRVQVFFPSCWDGENLDSDDHKSHVAYPEAGAFNDGSCPESHPVHLVSIFYEVIWNTGTFADQWYGDSQPFVLSNGDPTGYGFHGDFVSLPLTSIPFTQNQFHTKTKHRSTAGTSTSSKPPSTSV